MQVQDLVGFDGVVTMNFRVQLLALIGVNAVAAFAVEAASGAVVSLIRKHRPLPPLQLQFPPVKTSQPAAMAAGLQRRAGPGPFGVEAGVSGSLHLALPVVPSPPSHATERS